MGDAAITKGCVTLVLGGARSGKSVFAEQQVERSELNKIYIATAQAWDDEMKERIAQHRARRGDDWTTLDVPLDLVQTLKVHVCETAIVLVDCLTLWLNNLVMADKDPEQAGDDLVSALSQSVGRVVLVSNEVGLGIVPENALARRFRDAQGRLNQRVATVADDVYFLAAGLPMTLKSAS